jgi:RimJ/RimL family protein N-acetyltransferase
MLCPPATFGTARLAGRIPHPDDAPAVFAAYASDRAVTRFLSWRAYDRVEPLAQYLREAASRWEKGDGNFSWLLCRRGTHVPIGSIGVTFDGAGKALFGYVIARPLWGHGFATEALTFLADWALAQPAIWRAWAFCDVENPASARVMEKAGMAREGILRRWHSCPELGPEPRDCIACAKVR